MIARFIERYRGKPVLPPLAGLAIVYGGCIAIAIASLARGLS